MEETRCIGNRWWQGKPPSRWPAGRVLVVLRPRFAHSLGILRGCALPFDLALSAGAFLGGGGAWLSLGALSPQHGSVLPEAFSTFVQLA